MARNVEIKARIASIEALQPQVAALADRGPEPIEQDDTFFHCVHGRLKLRRFADGRGELIAYQRPDQAGPTASTYLITATTAPDALHATLAMALGEAGRLRKHRLLYLAGTTRLHLDRVESLGDFLEIEVVLTAQQSPEQGTRIARALLSHLNIGNSQLVAGAYIDLLPNPQTL